MRRAAGSAYTYGRVRAHTHMHVLTRPGVVLLIHSPVDFNEHDVARNTKGGGDRRRGVADWLAGCSDYLLPNCRASVSMNYSVKPDRPAGASTTGARFPHGQLFFRRIPIPAGSSGDRTRARDETHLDNASSLSDPFVSLRVHARYKVLIVFRRFRARARERVCTCALLS